MKFFRMQRVFLRIPETCPALKEFDGKVGIVRYRGDKDEDGITRHTVEIFGEVITTVAEEYLEGLPGDYDATMLHVEADNYRYMTKDGSCVLFWRGERFSFHSLHQLFCRMRMSIHEAVVAGKDKSEAGVPITMNDIINQPNQNL
jgi:hypothetical protein